MMGPRMRRLITLLSAGGNRIVMIRRQTTNRVHDGIRLKKDGVDIGDLKLARAKARCPACYVAIPEPTRSHGLADNYFLAAPSKSVSVPGAGLHAAGVMCQNLTVNIIISTQTAKVEMTLPEVSQNLTISAKTRGLQNLYS
jgi:hypothetical protein